MAKDAEERGCKRKTGGGGGRNDESEGESVCEAQSYGCLRTPINVTIVFYRHLHVNTFINGKQKARERARGCWAIEDLQKVTVNNSNESLCR